MTWHQGHRRPEHVHKELRVRGLCVLSRALWASAGGGARCKRRGVGVGITIWAENELIDQKSVYETVRPTSIWTAQFLQVFSARP